MRFTERQTNRWAFLLLLRAVCSLSLFVITIPGCGKSDVDKTAQTTSSHSEVSRRGTTIAIVSSLSGDLAANGKDMANGAEMALREAIASGMIAHTVNIEQYDDQGDPKIAVNVANQVCQNTNVVAVVGHLTSGCTLAAAPVYSRSNMPVVMPVPTNPEITEKGFRNIFRVPATDAEQAPFLARYVLSKDKHTRVAVVHDLTAYGMGFATAFRETLETSGDKVVALFEGVQKDVRDFRTLITKIKEKAPEYVLVAATYDMGAPFVRQMRELGLNATVLSGDGMFSTQYIELAGQAAEGTIVSFIAPSRGASPATDAFFAKYEEMYGKVVSFAPLGYDAGKVIASAISAASSVTREGILGSISRPEFQVDGVTGIIRFAANGDNMNKSLSLYVVRGGRFTLLRSDVSR